MARDYSKYQFNGQEFGKNRLVLEVIKRYVDDQNPTFNQLLNTFPADIQGSRGLFIEKSKHDALPEEADDKKNNRYFKKAEEVIELEDRAVLVTTQWGVDNIARFIKKAKSLGFEIGEPANSYDDVYWFLGASYGGNNDQTERFIKEGIWHCGEDDKFKSTVKSIKVGDKIAIKSTYTQTHNLPFDNGGNVASVMDIKAIGEVTENLNDGSTLKVNWQKNYKKRTWYMYTYQPRIWKVLPNKAESRALIDFAFNGSEQNYSLFLNTDELLTENSILLANSKSNLNTILYGPPGTGKTYHSIQAAVKAAEPEMFSALGIDERIGTTPEQRVELTRLYKELYNAGRIRFVTFHQSYGYEEFVEGLKASSDDGNISYDVEDGVFKAISIQAEKFLKPKEAESNYSFEKAWQVFTEQLSEEEFVEVQMPKTSFKVLDFNASRIFFEKKSGSQDHTLSISTLRAIFEERREYNSGLGVYYRPLVKYLKELSEPEQMPAIGRQNFVLIIDEINRGNISKIFGELITLIEPSKRLGQSEDIEVTLPYSGDKFSVPDNLYIIGTMNTADRSLALMDTALRRRFDFVEMMPDYNVLYNEEGLSFKVERDGFEIDLALLLQTLNKRISALYDREHQLGHAFLMPVVKAVAAGEDEKALHELKSCFQNKIIPLLAEYFFEDWQKIRLVLGDNQKPDNKKEKNYQIIQQSDVDYEKLFGDSDDVGDIADDVQDYKLIKADSELWTDPLTYIGIYSVVSLPKDQG